MPACSFSSSAIKSPQFGASGRPSQRHVHSSTTPFPANRKVPMTGIKKQDGSSVITMQDAVTSSQSLQSTRIIQRLCHPHPDDGACKKPLVPLRGRQQRTHKVLAFTPSFVASLQAGRKNHQVAQVIPAMIQLFVDSHTAITSVFDGPAWQEQDARRRRIIWEGVVRDEHPTRLIALESRLLAAVDVDWYVFTQRRRDLYHGISSVCGELNGRRRQTISHRLWGGLFKLFDCRAIRVLSLVLLIVGLGSYSGPEKLSLTPRPVDLIARRRGSARSAGWSVSEITARRHADDNHMACLNSSLPFTLRRRQFPSASIPHDNYQVARTDFPFSILLASISLSRSSATASSMLTPST